MKIDSEVLINDLVERSKQNVNAVEKLLQEPLQTLNWRASSESWSILECIEHLNLYGDFYLPEIGSKIETTRFRTPSPIFKSGLLGNYFAAMMLPKENLKKIKTFRDKDPIGSNLGKNTLERFIEQQKSCLVLLNKAKTIDLNRTKTAISITKLIKLRLGDTFRVLIYHNQRHLVQAAKVLEKQRLNVHSKRDSPLVR